MVVWVGCVVGVDSVVEVGLGTDVAGSCVVVGSVVGALVRVGGVGEIVGDEEQPASITINKNTKRLAKTSSSELSCFSF